MPPAYSPSAAKSNVLPKGDYEAELVAVKDNISKGEKTKGQATQDLTFKVYGPEGKEKMVFDQIIFPSDENPDGSHSLWKLKNLAKALGKEAEFEAGTFQAEEQVGSLIKATVSIESQVGYDDRNCIGNFKSAGTSSAPHSSNRGGTSGVPAMACGGPELTGAPMPADADIPF